MKNRNNKYNIYKNLSTIFDGKSYYLRNLEKRRNDGIKLINEKKKEIFFDDFFKLNRFKRDYSCFAYDISEENCIPIKIHVSKNINVYHPKKQEKDFARIEEDFPFKKIKNQNNNIQLGFPKRKIPNYVKSTSSKRKKLASIGKQVVSK